MRRIISILSLIFATSLSIFAETHTYRLEVGQFDKLRVFDNVNVVYKNVPDSTGMAVFEANEEFGNAFIFSNSKGALTVQVNTEDLGKPGLPTLTLYSDFLTEVENSSSFTTTLHMDVSVPAFTAKQIGNGSIIINNIKATDVDASIATGSGTISVNGTCTNAKLVMLGTGVIQADALEAKKVNCKILGSGTIGCFATETLNVRGIGSTKIYYKGNPEIKKVGGGKLFPINTETGYSSCEEEEEE